MCSPVSCDLSTYRSRNLRSLVVSSRSRAGWPRIRVQSSACDGPPHGACHSSCGQGGLSAGATGNPEGTSHGDTLGRLSVGPSCRKPSDCPGAACPGQARPPQCVPRFQGRSVKMLAESSLPTCERETHTRRDLLKRHRVLKAEIFTVNICISNRSFQCIFPMCVL